MGSERDHFLSRQKCVICESLQSEAVKVDLEQNMLCNSDMSSTKIYVASHGRVIKFTKYYKFFSFIFLFYIQLNKFLF